MADMNPMLPASPYRILLADDHALFRREVRRILDGIAEWQVVGEAGSGPELFQHLTESIPDLVIMDSSMPNLRVVDATHRIKLNHPGVKVLTMTMDPEEEYLHEALAAGAEGCICKQDAGWELYKAIDTIRRGFIYRPISCLPK